MEKIIFTRSYSDEDLYDLDRHLFDAFDPALNPILNTIPVDQQQYMKGTFKVEVTWTE